MKLDNNMRWIILIAAIILIVNIQNIVPKEAVADIDGKACTKDADCPCIGKYNYTTISNPDAFGIGVGSCNTTKQCDMSLCLGLEPLGVWVKENPIEWMTSNPLYAIAIIGLLAMVLFWPKQ